MEEESPFITINDAKNEPFVWTFRRKMVVLSLCFVYIVAFSNLSILAPFFPSEAQNKGVTSTLIGLIFATSSLVSFLTGPFYGYLIRIYGPRFILLTSLFLNGAASILMGFSILLPDGLVFLTFCIVLRAVCAFGGAGYETAVMTIAIGTFPTTIGRITALLETSIAIGYCIGPVLGGVLYTIGGFRLPFFALGTLMLLAMPVAYCILPTCEVMEQANSKTSTLQAIKIPGVAMLALVLVSAGISFGFVEPIIGPYLKKYGVSSSHIGLIFILLSAIYGFSAPFVGWFGDKTQRYRLCMVSGLVIAALSYFLLGPAPFLNSFLPTGKVWLVCVSFGFAGVGGSFLVAPTMPDMLRSAKSGGMPDDMATNSVLSGIFISMINLGSACGPLLSGYLNDKVGFQWANAVAGFILLCQAFVLAIFTVCEGRMCRRRPQNVHNEDEHQLLLGIKSV